MDLKTASRRLCLFSCCALVLGSCAYRDPPQTGFYCVDVPDGRSGDASPFVESLARRLNFKVSEAQFASEKGPPNHVWEVYGRGVSIFVGTAMKDGQPDRAGNIETTFNPNRLGLNVAKTGLWQKIAFEDVLAAARDTARQFGMPFSKADAGRGCST